MGLLEGKKGLILNIANDRSIATHIATQAIREGAKCGFGFLPMDNPEKSQRRVRKAMDENGFPNEWLHPCDVSSDESIEKFFSTAQEQFGTIDFLVHCLAFANRDYLKKDAGVFTSTPREVFRQAVDISAYSLHRPCSSRPPHDARRGLDHRPHLSRQRKSDPGVQRDGRGESGAGGDCPLSRFRFGGKENPRQLHLGRPVKTLSAMAVGGIDEMFAHMERKAPLHRNVEAEEVGKTAVFLLSDLSSGITGETLYVDCGFSTVGL